MKIPKKVEERLICNLPKFQKVLNIAKARDLNESDTVSVITDILSDVFGYEKYLEVTSELAIRGTYCDLAVKIGDKIQFLIECKAIGTELKEAHLRQAVGYGANKGIQWLILTNGSDWQVYRLRFEQPIAWDLVVRFDLFTLSVRDERALETLFLVSKEGVEKNVRDDVYEKIQCVNRFVVGALMMSEPVIQAVKRELRKIAEGVRVEDSEIEDMIRESVLRRDLVEGDEALIARNKVSKSVKSSTPVKKPCPKPDESKCAQPQSDCPEKSMSEQLLDQTKE
jgi:hypothetical protein